MISRLSASALALSLCGYALAQDNCTTTCQSFGVDFVDGGSYFQNVDSTQPFTAVQEFEGCQDDESNNILVDPSGEQYECSKTPLTPDDTRQTVTCPIDKDQLTSGEWSLIIISNNGQCDPIDYIRQFSLSVGPQSTTTVVPTVTLTTTSTPISSTIITSTTTIVSSASPSTTTAVGAPSATVTYYPLPTITIVTRGVFTITSTSQVASIVATSTVTTSGPCAFAALAEPTPEVKNLIPDPINNKISVSILGNNIARAAEPTLITRRGGSTFSKRKEEIIQIRSPALQKRAPDEPTTTIIDSTAVPSTSTSTIYAPTQTVTGTTTLVSTSTTTPVVTVSQGGAKVTTVTASRKTITNTFFIPATQVVVTRTSALTATVTSSLGC
ncbi:hypothetical protein M409DRAFT_24191 [Zasmidium cellare ATCC 36951]|uniref:Uncharacterized protein n=1 Tax=Zasmidium cellare ATCC 36951 TaxID=1080233 RepID=A0A6A6CHC6_ZASCE|nr:uncharacterized protein M409DRAFT_24191 [Zasmidium cellare ATCC 36951]KAF2165342.1 hypothetical protein M409DRAFT_24191 [Zasmidium cellare ATCC 36951]